MRKNNKAYSAKVQWSHPMGIKELSQIFDVHRNTISEWLKKQTICNRQLSPRRWQVAKFEMPCDLSNDKSIETETDKLENKLF